MPDSALGIITPDIQILIDADGFRPNVGIVLADGQGRVLWARRVGQSGWQFPQGGIHTDENPEQAMYRELREEIGLKRGDVELLASTRGWLRYRLPEALIRKGQNPLCVGQKQKWFLLRMTAPEHRISFDCGDKPEFDHWEWVSYWYPVGQVVAFKRGVYRRALKELSPRHCRLTQDRGKSGNTT